MKYYAILNILLLALQIFMVDCLKICETVINKSVFLLFLSPQKFINRHDWTLRVSPNCFVLIIYGKKKKNMLLLPLADKRY